METAFPILNGIHRLPLGEVFQYILSMEWGKASDPETNHSNQETNGNQVEIEIYSLDNQLRARLPVKAARETEVLLDENR